MNNPKFAPHKAGSTFSYAGTCQLPAGAWSATAQLRAVADNALLGTLTVTLGAAPSPEAPANSAAAPLPTPIALYAAATDTALWPPGVHQLDIRYAQAGAPPGAPATVLHTSTLLLPVTRAVTQG